MKEKGVSILAYVSLTALSIFLGYWIQSNYQKEKEILRDRLENSIAKVNDSINEQELERIFFFIQDTVDVDVIGNSETVTYEGLNQDTFIHVSRMPSRSRIINSNNSKGNFSIKIDAQAGDGSAMITSRKTGINFQSDTTIVSRLFSFDEQEVNKFDSILPVVLADELLPNSFTIKSLEDTILGEMSILLRDRTVFQEKQFVAIFDHYQPYLLNAVFPEIILSLSLLSLIAFSFFLAIKSVRVQQRMGKLKNDFISNMTHELKTPISTVGVAIEAMQNFGALNSPEKSKEYLEIAGNELSRLTILVDKVLKMSQFDTAGAPLGKITEVDFKEVLQNVSSSMKLQLEKYEASLTTHIEGEDFTLQGDKVHLANIIYNLLDNALKYGGVSPAVEISLEDKLQTILLKVKDHGIGIAKEFQGKVFDQFFRIPKGNIHDVKGYGLGLSYVAGVVKAHGGEISLESAENLGTTFIISFPKHV